MKFVHLQGCRKAAHGIERAQRIPVTLECSCGIPHPPPPRSPPPPPPLLPWTLCFPLDRQRCGCLCELTAHGGPRAYRCGHAFGGL